MQYSETYLLTLSSTLQASINRVKELHTRENWDVCPVCIRWDEAEQDYVGFENPCPTMKALYGNS